MWDVIIVCPSSTKSKKQAHQNPLRILKYVLHVKCTALTATTR